MRTNSKWKRINLPYGMWTLSDGTEVLFNRDYIPIYERIGQTVTVANPETYYKNIDKDKNIFYYNDLNQPWINKTTYKKCIEILSEWGFRFDDGKV